MKKIPTLFEREFSNHTVIKVYPKVTPGLEWVLTGEGDATVKWDGACCAVINGKFYKRYDAKVNKKNGEFKTPPKGAIPCDSPDRITGHWPHWVLIDKNNPDDKWYIEAKKEYERIFGLAQATDGTYEAIGRHFNGNPYNLESDFLQKHGIPIINALKTNRSFESIRDYLEKHPIEGIVFWKNGEPKCKIKRTDFGFTWPLNTSDPVMFSQFVDLESLLSMVNYRI